MSASKANFHRLLYSASVTGVFEYPLAINLYERDEFSGQCVAASLGERGFEVKEFNSVDAAKKYLADRIAEHLLCEEAEVDREGIRNERVEWDDPI